MGKTRTTRKKKGGSKAAVSPEHPASNGSPAQFEQPVPVEPPALTAMLTEDSDPVADSDHVATKQKKQKVVALLTEEQEESMVEWLENNPILYNRKLKTYKDTNKKDALWREKAEAMGIDVLILKTWYSSLRTRYGRLKKFRSGQEDPELTERDAWILRCFDFLRPHIVEVQKRTVVSVGKQFIPICIESLITARPYRSLLASYQSLRRVCELLKRSISIGLLFFR